MATDQLNWAHEYEKIRPKYLEFSKKLKILLKDLLNKGRIPFRIVEHRTKSLASFEGKINRPEKQYNYPLEEITDLSGNRVIVDYTDDADRVIELVKKEFFVHPEYSEYKAETLKPRELGYRGTNLVVSLNEGRKSLSEWKDFASFKAEIQIHTVLQHFWASNDHVLRYKKEEDIPSQLRRKLFLISAILELVDEQFNSLKRDFDSLNSVIIKKIEAKDFDLEINTETLREYIKTDTVQQLLTIAEKVKSSRVSIGREAKSGDLSKLVSICQAIEISRLSDLDNVLSSSMEYAKRFYEYIFKGIVIAKWTLAVPFLVSLLLISLEYKTVIEKNLPGWSDIIMVEISRFRAQNP